MLKLAPALASIPKTRKIVAGVAAVAALAFPAAYTVSLPGKELVKKHEGLRLTAYRDPVNIATICWGSTERVRLGTTETLEHCRARLDKDLRTAGNAVVRHVKIPITQTQYDALVSWTFNLGERRLQNSTMLKRINAGQCEAAGREMLRWVYAGQNVLRGLVIRRQDEKALWDAGCKYW